MAVPLQPLSTNIPHTVASGTYYPPNCTYHLQERDFQNPHANDCFHQMKKTKLDTMPVPPQPKVFNPVEEQIKAQVMQQQAEQQREAYLASFSTPEEISNNMIANQFQRKKKPMTVREIQHVDRQAQTLWNEKISNEQSKLVHMPPLWW
eukprot:NODE_539_length_754_cov_249.940989_g530_i0.p1 GENE.NODE_539_length_754_cov_249.940989_g530_i0~~NODE_539_length_754_cov_249.940989_g530_i0.p1  ORF type:complete len:149 (+),score=33.35 NODE_539_length_754_cov_249.940989_g530_i0:52-498(+)